MTRRSFLSQTLAASGASLAPMIVPGHVLGRGGVAPSNRIVLGGIGIGRRGRAILTSMLAEPDVQYVATCDVQARLRAEVKALADQKYGTRDCATYRDFRELLARSDIDAVVIATGDRWHSVASIYAARTGKDVYCEKPCGITIGHCQAVADTFEATGQVFQAGMQRRSALNIRFAVELARSGKLGRLHTVHASIYKLRVRYDWLPAEPEPPRDEIDWDLWLGPAPWRPYNKSYVVDSAWQGFYDFDSGATLLDWGAHTVDICQMAGVSDQAVPVEYEPAGDTVNARYANGLKLVMRPAGWIGQPPPGQWASALAKAATGNCPVRFDGDDGWVETGDSGMEVHPASLRGEWETFLKRQGSNRVEHTRDFLNAVKSRGRPVANHRVMRTTHLTCHAAAIAWQLGRRLRFDPTTETFPADAEANRMARRALREPWTI